MINHIQYTLLCTLLVTNFNSGTPGFYRTFRRSWTTFRFTFRLHMHFDDWGTKIKDIISKPPLSPRRNGKIETLLYFLITGIPSFLGNIFPFPVYINMINHILSIFYLLHCYLPCTYMHKNRYYTSCLYFFYLFLELSIVSIGEV